MIEVNCDIFEGLVVTFGDEFMLISLLVLIL